MKNMFREVIQIQAMELLVFTRLQSKATFLTAGRIKPAVYPFEGILSAWVLSNIPLFNQAYCWLALRYTVMRYFIH